MKFYNKYGDQHFTATWEKIRAKGFVYYLLTQGLLYGVLLFLLNCLFDIQAKPYAEVFFSIEALFKLFSWFICGCLFGFFSWKHYEKRYLKLKQGD